MKIRIIFLLFIGSLFSEKIVSQNYNWPICDFVERHEDLRNFIKCSVDNEGNIYIGNKLVEHFENEIYDRYKYQMLNKQLDFSLMKIEIQVDSSTLFSHVNNLLNNLSTLNLNSVFLVARSKKYYPFNNIWTVGLSHEIYDQDSSQDLKSKLKKELKIPPPPPSPPYATGGSIYDPKTDFTLKHYYNNSDEYAKLAISVNKEGCLLNKKGISKTKLKEEISKSIIEQKTVFEIKFVESTTYAEVVNVLSNIKHIISEIRNKYCLENLFETYNKLSYSEQKLINDRYPELIIIKK